MGDGSGPSAGARIREANRGGEDRDGNVQVDDPLVLELTPTCQALFWPGDFLERPSGVLERGGLGTNGDGTMVVPVTGPGYSEELEFDLELPGVT